MARVLKQLNKCSKSPCRWPHKKFSSLAESKSPEPITGRAGVVGEAWTLALAFLCHFSSFKTLGQSPDLSRLLRSQS